MSIKKISFPIFIIALIFIALYFIKPTVLSILDKRAVKETKLIELQSVENTKASIGTLSEARAVLLAKSEGQLALAYLPLASDQDRVLDMLNYLATQGGASIDSMSFVVEPREVPLPAEPMAPLPDGSIPPTPPVAPSPQLFSVKVAMTGTYEGMKAFMEKLSMINRFHEIKSFAIVEPDIELDSEGAPTAPSGFLEGSLEAVFSYLPEGRYDNAYLHPVFSSKQFDTKAFDKLASLRADTPPLTEPAATGRPNPFSL